MSLPELTIGIEEEYQIIDPDTREVTRIEGNADDPISRGHVCPKAFALRAVHEDPDRLRRPLRRVRGRAGAATDRWEEISWDAAFDLAAERLRAVQAQHGSDALGVYIGNPSGFDVGTMLYNGFVMHSLRTSSRLM